MPPRPCKGERTKREENASESRKASLQEHEHGARQRNYERGDKTYIKSTQNTIGGDTQDSRSPQNLIISTNNTELLQEVTHYLKKSIYTSYDELPLLLSVKQLVDLMGVSDSTIYELIQEADFPSLRIGKRIVVPKEELRKWISAHTKGVQE